jgi:hypothetical protein
MKPGGFFPPGFLLLTIPISNISFSKEIRMQYYSKEQQLLRIVDLLVTTVDCIHNAIKMSLTTRRLFRIHATEYGRITQELRSKVWGQPLEFYHELAFMTCMKRIYTLVGKNSYFSTTPIPFIKDLPYGDRAEIRFITNVNGVKTAMDIFESLNGEGLNTDLDWLLVKEPWRKIQQYQNECAIVLETIPYDEKGIRALYALIKDRTETHINPFFKPIEGFMSAEEAIGNIYWFYDFAKTFIYRFQHHLNFVKTPRNPVYSDSSTISDKLMLDDLNDFFIEAARRFDIKMPLRLQTFVNPTEYAAQYYPIFNLSEDAKREQAILEADLGGLKSIEEFAEWQRKLPIKTKGEFMGGIIAVNIDPKAAEFGDASGIDFKTTVRGYIVHELTHARQYELYYPTYFDHLNQKINSRNGSPAEVKNLKELDPEGKAVCEQLAYHYEIDEAEAYRNEYAYIMSKITSAFVRKEVSNFYMISEKWDYVALTDFIEW